MERKMVVILAHSTKIKGPIDHLEYFLEKKGYTFSKINHPLDQYDDSFTTTTYNGDLKRKIKRSQRLSYLNLIIDFWLNILFLLKANDTRLMIGANNFDTFSALCFKKVFRKKNVEVIYFGSDYSEDRFKIKLLNNIYNFVEKYCNKNSNYVISNTYRAEAKRLELGLNQERSLIIPNGVLLEKEYFSHKKINKSYFIYVGMVSREHGLYEMINLLSPIIKKLVVIGYGEDWERIKKLCKEKKLDAIFKYQKSHNYVIEYLQGFNGIGLAPYNLLSKWTYYCSPLKVNEYVACGVPVIISSIPEISNKINKDKLGIVYDNLKLTEIQSKLENLNIENYNVKAKRFYYEYNYDSLYERIPLNI